MTQDSHQFHMRHVHRGSENLGLKAYEVAEYRREAALWARKTVLKLLVYGLAAWAIVLGPVVILIWMGRQ